MMVVAPILATRGPDIGVRNCNDWIKEEQELFLFSPLTAGVFYRRTYTQKHTGSPKHS